MKKIVAILLILFLASSMEIFSSDRPHRISKSRKTEQINKKSSRYGMKHMNRKSQKRMQKLRIKNHNAKKMNIMRKR